MSAIIQHLLARLDLWHDSLQHLGWLGVLGFAIGLVLLQMAFIPLSIFAVAAGAIFGFWKGVLAITIGTNAGAAVNFLIARYVARGTVTRYLSHHEKFRLIDAAIGREGGKIVALLRLCPMPFGLCNYCYGLTSIPFSHYFWATFVSIIPANCFFTWVGSSAHAGLAVAAGGSHEHRMGNYILMGVGLVAAYCALSYITRLAKDAISRGEPTEPTEPAESKEPMESAEEAEPNEPAESTEPTASTDPSEPKRDEAPASAPDKTPVA